MEMSDSSEKPTLLIVDDEPDNLEALRRQLRNHYTVETTTSGAEALRLLQQKTFNVIISDQRMPQVTGVELLEKAQRICPDTTRILLTGYSDLDAVIQAINRGNVYRYIPKPWDPNELQIALKQAVDANLMRTALAHKTQQLEKALTDLQALDAAKARFLNLVSHELNTPLTALGGFVSLLEQAEPLPQTELKKSVAALRRAHDRLETIVQEVLEFVRLEADREWPLSTVALDEVLRNLGKTLKPFEKSHQVELVLQLLGSPSCTLNPARIEQALKLLLRYFVSSAPAKSRVRAVLKATSGEIVLEISRSGPPLPATALEPLEMTTQPLSHGRDLGISLSIAKRIIDRHGGSLNVVPDLDEGAAIRLTLPMR